MKKHTLLSIIALFLIIVFNSTSCKKDGVYNPVKKIHKIYTQKDKEKKTLTETWTWNEKKLSRIDYIDSYSLFEYDGKQISKITNSHGSYMEFTYKGSKIDKISYYADNKLLEVYNFKHDGGKISKITLEEYTKDEILDKTNQTQIEILKNNALRFVLPEQFCETVIESSLLRKNLKSGESTISTMDLTWYEKNVVKMIYEHVGDYRTYILTYTYNHDNKRNPLNGFLSYNMDEFVFSYSKNNIIRKFIADNNGDSWEYNYTYIYDGNCPIQATRIRKIASYSETFITYYEYEN